MFIARNLKWKCTCCNVKNKNSQCPNINFLIIRKDTFWSKIVESTFCTIDFLFIFSFRRKTKITNFNLQFLIQKDITWLYITMNYILLMKVRYSFSNLISKFLYKFDRHTKIGIVVDHISEEISLLTILQHHVKIDLIMKLIIEL